MPIGCTSWYVFMRSSLVNIVLCQSFNLWIEYPKLPFTRCNDIPRCNYSFAFVRCMFWIYDATTLMINVAWSQSVTPPCVHSSLISYIVLFKQIIVPSKRSNWTTMLIKTPNFIYRKRTFINGINQTNIDDPFITISFTSFLKSKLSKICLGFANMAIKPPHINVYHVPQ